MMNAGNVGNKVTGRMNVEVVAAIRIETVVDTDAEVTHVIEEDPHQEAEEAAEVIQGTTIEEKEDALAAKRRVTLEQTVQKAEA